MDIFISSAIAALTAGLSTYGIMRGHKSAERQTETTNNTAQIQTIFDGYSRIVADLHAEVQRLHQIVDDLHKELEACEERNIVLEKELEDVMGRLCRLEEQTDAGK